MRTVKRTIVSLVLSVVAASTVGLVAVNPAQARVGAPHLSVGSSGSGVWCVQRIINRWWGGGALVEDSQFGPNTRAWVVYFQGRRGLDDDGIVGPRTGNSLLSAVGGDSYCYRYLPTTS